MALGGWRAILLVKRKRVFCTLHALANTHEKPFEGKQTACNIALDTPTLDLFVRLRLYKASLPVQFLARVFLIRDSIFKIGNIRNRPWGSGVVSQGLRYLS